MKSANGVITVAGAATGSLGASFNSDPFKMENMDLAAIQAVISGSSALNATLKLQASCDMGQDTGTGPAGVQGLTNWVDVASSTTTVTADGVSMWNVSAVAWKWVRVVYTRTAGSGTIALLANAKGRS